MVTCHENHSAFTKCCENPSVFFIKDWCITSKVWTMPNKNKSFVVLKKHMNCFWKTTCISLKSKARELFVYCIKSFWLIKEKHSPEIDYRVLALIFRLACNEGMILFLLSLPPFWNKESEEYVYFVFIICVSSILVYQYVKGVQADRK